MKHKAVKFKTTIEFNFPYPIRGRTQELKDFIKDALECWGGQRHPDDWLFDSLENVTVGPFKLKELP